MPLPNVIQSLNLKKRKRVRSTHPTKVWEIWSIWTARLRSWWVLVGIFLWPEILRFSRSTYNVIMGSTIGLDTRRSSRYNTFLVLYTLYYKWVSVFLWLIIFFWNNAEECIVWNVIYTHQIQIMWKWFKWSIEKERKCWFDIMTRMAAYSLVKYQVRIVIKSLVLFF